MAWRAVERVTRLAGAAPVLALVLALPHVALGAEPTPVPSIGAQDALAGPVIGLMLVAVSSALAVGIAFGLRKRMDAVGGRSRESGTDDRLR